MFTPRQSCRKKNTFYKNSNPSCIDLFITNCTKSFQHTHSFSCGISDHHNFVVTVLKNTFGKQKSNIKYYKDWKKFDDAVFRTELREELELKIIIISLLSKHFFHY